MEKSISKWALIRRNELVDVPEDFCIHTDFLLSVSKEEGKKAFREIHDLFYEIYTKMAAEPEYFSFPLQEVGELAYFSKEEQEVRKKPWDLFLQLFYLFSKGSLTKDRVNIPLEELAGIAKIKNYAVYFQVLSDYGFLIQGLSKGKLPKTGDGITIEYPDNTVILSLLSLVAKKVMYVQMAEEPNLTAMDVMYRNAFISWNYKIVADNLQTISASEESDYVADKLKTEDERKTAAKLHSELLADGYHCKKAGQNEGPCLRYYLGSAGTYEYALDETDGKLRLEIRIKNAEKCLPLLKDSGERIYQMFLQSDPGCQNRVNGTCRSAVRFMLDGELRWHCACCGAPFQIAPVMEEIPIYRKLVQAGKGK